MPESMISAETGGSEKVSGRSMAMVAKRPEARQHADGGAEQAADEGVEQVPGRSAVAKPRPRWSSSSMARASLLGRGAGRGGGAPAAAARGDQ